jgi:hypothetical protein
VAAGSSTAGRATGSRSHRTTPIRPTAEFPRKIRVDSLEDSCTTSQTGRSSSTASSWLMSSRLTRAKVATPTAMAVMPRAPSRPASPATRRYRPIAGARAVAYMPRLKTALTGARRCTTWAASSPASETAMACPAGSRAMLATTMPS